MLIAALSRRIYSLGAYIALPVIKPRHHLLLALEGGSAKSRRFSASHPLTPAGKRIGGPMSSGIMLNVMGIASPVEHAQKPESPMAAGRQAPWSVTRLSSHPACALSTASHHVVFAFLHSTEHIALQLAPILLSIDPHNIG